MKKGKELFVVPLFDTEGPTTGRDDLHSDWGKLHTHVKYLTEMVRRECPDAGGNPMVMSWFLLDWVGYDTNNSVFKERKYSTGYHRVLDEYRKDIFSDKALSKSGDGVYWHYHHPPKDGSWGWNRGWNDSQWYEEILNRKILERNFFPSVYRAGGYVEDNDTSRWLEKWIPFDYSNNAPAYKEGAYDWSRAPKSWVPYHPSANDYQAVGDMNRLIAKNLPVFAKGGSNMLRKEDVVLAFEEAEAGKRPILSFGTHDYYKSADNELTSAYNLIMTVAKDYPDVVWSYENALDAIRKSATLRKRSALTLKITEGKGGTYTISASHEIFGPEPYVVLKSGEDTYTRIDTEKLTKASWCFHIDRQNVTMIGVAANDSYGNTAVIHLSL